MFLIRFSTDAEESIFNTIELLPGPTDVSYPDERRLQKIQFTQDDAVVIQRPLRDPRPRKWIWMGYRPTIPTYENQWTTLLTLEVKAREIAGLAPYVYIWEDDSTIGGFSGLTSGTEPDGTYSNVIWTQVKFIQVHRQPRTGGGRVIYEHSTVEFVIDTTSYTDF